ncbi:hypothetical protein I551_8473 [Mycobacterium ulcerans str. Harvey]|uniref:Uncharacterized protein n=1 Tax=Mycobacterium ulcerans str. Harvey TaxID=1299332 RepID=A0ABN0RAP5_MYCUL|nr:hypothetical protein I551_8473 [Mycobacterium ulcerans str. Harvey]
MTISQLDPAGYMDAFRRGLECNTDPTFGRWDWRLYSEEAWQRFARS